MGKGQRARAERAGKRQEMKIRAKRQKLKEKITKIVGYTVGIIAAVAIVCSVAYNVVADTGYFLRNTVAMQTENFKVDNAMMTYYLKNEYYSFANQYADYLSMYGLDTSKSLKAQKYGDGTWFDYFLTQAKTQVNDLLLCAEKAKEEGKELTDEQRKTIDESIDTMKTYAKNNNMSLDKYLSAAFSAGINEKDVRKAIELSVIASEYSSAYTDNLKYTTEQLEKFYSENKSNYVKADYLSYGLTSTNTDKTAAKTESKDFADKLAAAKNADEFKTTLKSLLTDYYTKINTTEDEGEAKVEIEEKVETALSSIEGTSYYPSAEADKQTALEKWMFDANTKVGDIFVDEPTGDSLKYTVYVMTKTMYRDDYKTKNVSHIYIATTENAEQEALDDAKKKADDILAEYNKGDKTKESFKELAIKYSDDANAKTNGGLYEGVTKNTSSYPTEFINWAYDEKRAEGDVEVIKTSSGYHVMRYEGEGEIAWVIAATADKKSADWSAHLDEVAKKHKVETNEDKMKGIKG